MRAFRSSVTHMDRDSETGEEFTKAAPILVVQFNNRTACGQYLMRHDQQADHLATLLTQFGNDPDELLRMSNLFSATAMRSAEEGNRSTIAHTLDEG